MRLSERRLGHLMHALPIAGGFLGFALGGPLGAVLGCLGGLGGNAFVLFTIGRPVVFGDAVGADRR